MKNIHDVNTIIWAIDNHPGIEKFGISYENIFISFWMLIRETVNQELAAMVGYGSTSRLSSTMNFSYLKILISAYKNKLKKNKTDVLFISPSIGNIHHGNKVENIYHDLLAQTLMNKGKKVIILEQPNKIEFFKKRKVNVCCYSMTWLYLKRKLKFLLLSPFIIINKNIIQNFISLIGTIIKKYLVEVPFLEKINKHLIHIVKAVKFEIKMWMDIIQLTQPKVVIRQDILCGGSSGISSLVFKKKHIIVIEDQHGLISRDDPRYNFGGKLKNNLSFSSFLPDYFLLYGQGWADKINLNTKKVVIGNAYFSNTKTKKINDTSVFDVLVISDSERPDFTIERMTPLLTHHYKILFRPHPREMSIAFKRYRTLLNHNNVVFDMDRNIYHSIIKSKVVICMIGSFLTTVVYESIAMGKTIFCLCDDVNLISDHDEIKHCVEFVERGSNLIQRLEDIYQNIQSSKPQRNDFYHDEWENNFHQLIDAMGV